MIPWSALMLWSNPRISWTELAGPGVKLAMKSKKKF
jgi:hypothetical protein